MINRILSLYKYLLNRKRAIQIGSVKFTFIDVNCGVPQNSILSPLLFAVSLDDIFNEKFNSFMVACSDDIKIGGCLSSLLQAVLKTILEWIKRNSIKINVSKCETLHLGSKTPNFDYNLMANQYYL